MGPGDFGRLLQLADFWFVDDLACQSNQLLMLLSVMHDFPCVSCNITTKAKLFKKAIQKETNLSASNNCDFLQFDCAMSFCKE